MVKFVLDHENKLDNIAKRAKINNRMDKKVMYIRDVDEKLKREFKALCCTMRGKTLAEEVQRLMREELERRKKELAKEVNHEV